MPGIVRQPDLCTGGFMNVTASFSTFVNNLPVVRYGDIRQPHPKKPPCIDIGATVSGADIYVDNLHVQYIGHPTTLDTQVQGSPNVIGN